MQNAAYCDLNFVTPNSGNFLKGMCFKGYAKQQYRRL